MSSVGKRANGAKRGKTCKRFQGRNAKWWENSRMPKYDWSSFWSWLAERTTFAFWLARKCWTSFINQLPNSANVESKKHSDNRGNIILTRENCTKLFSLSPFLVYRSPSDQSRPEPTGHIGHDVLSPQNFAFGVSSCIHGLSHCRTDPSCHGLVGLLLTVWE